MTRTLAAIVVAVMLGPLAGCIAPPGPEAPAAREDGRGTDLAFAQWTEGRFVAHAPAVVAEVHADGLFVHDGGRAWTLRFEGASPDARVEGLDPTGGVANVHLGQDPSAWRSGIPLHAAVAVRGAWPGIDVVVRGAAGALKYDVVLAPGARVEDARLGVVGAERLEIAEDGAVLARAGDAVLRDAPPVAWQPGGGSVVARHVLRGGASFGFEAADADPALPLVIDPALRASTFLGGSKEERSWAVAVDASGASYVSGETQSPDMVPAGTPGQRGGVAMTNNLNHDARNAFVAKVSPDGRTLQYVTIFGGAATEEPEIAYALALGAGGVAYAAGYTHSWDFPTTADAYQPFFRSVAPTGSYVTTANAHDLYDGFLVRLDAGGALTYGTFLGGTKEDFIYGVDVGPDGTVVVAGSTNSLDFPTTVDAYQQSGVGAGGGDLRDVFWGFVTRFVSFGNGALDVGASTIFGAYNHVEVYDVDLDDANRPWITGYRYALAPPPTPGAPDHPGTHSGSRNAYVAALPASLGKPLLYSASIGGLGGDEGYGVRAVGGAGGTLPLVYVAGKTGSADVPATRTLGAGGGVDLFVMKLDPAAPAGEHARYLTRIGGRDDDVARGLDVDAQGRAYVAGHTGTRYFYDPQFPTTTGADGTFAACQPGTARDQDAIVARLDPSGAVDYATYLGGARGDAAEEVAVGADGIVHVVGNTASRNFPNLTDAPQRAPGGSLDGFLSRLEVGAAPDCPPTPPAQPDPCLSWSATDASAPFNGEAIGIRVTLTNCGRALNTGLPGAPQHRLAWDLYVASDGHWEWGTSDAFGGQPELPSIPTGATKTVFVNVSVKKCWNGALGTTEPCPLGDYRVRWDVIEGHSTDPEIPTSHLSAQNASVGWSNLTIRAI